MNPNLTRFNAFLGRFLSGPRLEFVKLSDTAQIPRYATKKAVGMDLFADEDKRVPILGHVMVKTNIGVRLPDHLEGQVRARSGLAYKNGLTVLNGPGTIDPDYTGGIGVILFNAGAEAYEVKKGDRIAQFVIAPFVRVTPIWLDGENEGLEPSLAPVDRTGGFGSTGVGVAAGAALAAFQPAPGLMAAAGGYAAQHSIAEPGIEGDASLLGRFLDQRIKASKRPGGVLADA